MLKNICSVFILSILLTQIANAQDFSAYQKKWFIRGTDTLPYRILLPENYKPSARYPLILVLHGSGERGNDNEKQLIHGGDLFIRKGIRDSFPAIVVFPQCPERKSWANFHSHTDAAGNRVFDVDKEDSTTLPMQLLEKLVVQLQKDYRINNKMIYVGGLSMGGMGTFDLVRRRPSWFAAAFPICGAGDPSAANQMRKVSWWIFHGAKDNTVPPTHSIQMADALKKAGADAKLTIYPEAGHNSWDNAFAEKDLLPWLFSQHRK
jgi:predicted peptidase